MKSYGSKVLDFLVKTLNGMALGLFATLIVGVIIDQFGTLSSDLETILPEKSYIPTQYLGDGSPDEAAYHLINFFDSQEQKNLGTYYFDEVMSSIEDKVLRKTDARNQIIMVDTTTMRKVSKQLKEIDIEAFAKTSN